MKFKTLALFCFLVLLIPNLAQASLLGTTFFLSHRFPTIDSVIESYPVTVQEGTADRQIFGSFYTADPEDTVVQFDFFRAFSFENDPFNGHYMDFLPSTTGLVAIDTNINGWDSSRLALGNNINSNWYSFNWAGLQVNQGDYFNASFDFETQNGTVGVVPEPSTLALVGLGLIGAFARRKKA